MTCTVTVAVCVIATELMVAVTVLVSGTTELSEPVATPLALVVTLGCVRTFPAPVASNTTVTPAIGFPNASFAVTVIVELSVPARMVLGSATTVDWVSLTPPAVPVAVNVTGLPVRPALAALNVFVPAVVPSVQEVSVAMPLAFVAMVAGEAGTIVPPPPVTVNVTTTPLTGLLD